MRIQDLQEKARRVYNPHAQKRSSQPQQQAQRAQPQQRPTAYVDRQDHQEVTQPDLEALEKMIDSLFHTVGIDVALSKVHFLRRMNDMRGPVTTKELGNLFQKAFAKYGKLLAKSGPDMQAVITDMQSDVNVPFVLAWNRDKEMLDLTAKSVMKKPNYRTSNRKLKV